MSLGDFVLLREGAFGAPGARGFQVQAGGTPPAINPGEFVLKALGQQYATPLTTNKPVIATDFLAGLSASASTELAATTDGKVEVFPLTPGLVYLGTAKVASGVATQALYNALVGKRVLIDITSNVSTVLVADGATSGCVIEDLDVAKYPGKIAFSIRAAAFYAA